MPKGQAARHPHGAAHCSVLLARSAQHAWTHAPQRATRCRACTPPSGASAQGLARRGSSSTEPRTPSAPNPRQRMPISKPRSPQPGWITKAIQPPCAKLAEPTAPAPGDSRAFETHLGAKPARSSPARVHRGAIANTLQRVGRAVKKFVTKGKRAPKENGWTRLHRLRKICFA